MSRILSQPVPDGITLEIIDTLYEQRTGEMGIMCHCDV